MVFGRVVRPELRRAINVSRRRRGKKDAGRHRRGARWTVPGCRSRAGRAGHCRAEALAKAARWSTPSELPDQTKVHDYLKNLPGIDTKTVNEKTRRAGAVKSHTATYTSPISPMLRSDRLARRGNDRQYFDGVVAHAGPYPLRADLAKTTAFLRSASALFTRKVPAATAIMVQTTRARCGTALDLRQRAYRKAAMDARRIRLGAVRLGNDDAARGGVSADGTICRLAIRSVELHPQYASGQSERGEPARASHIENPLNRATPAELGSAPQAAATATPCRPTIRQPENHRPFHSRYAFARLGASGLSAVSAMSSRWSPSWTRWRTWPAPIRSRSA